MTEKKQEESEGKIYRSATDEFDKKMHVVGTKAWMALACFLGILLLVFVWSLFGKIPVKVAGWGISLSSEGAYIIVAQTEGTVVEILAREGSTVKAGDVIAKIADPNNALKIETQKEKIFLLEKEFKALKDRVKREEEVRTLSIQKKIDSINLQRSNVENRLPYLEKDLESKTKLSEQGILAKPDVEKAKSELANAKSQLESYNAELASLKADLAVNTHAGEIEAKKNDLFAARKELELLLLQGSFTNIKTARAGLLIEINISVGNRVQVGQMVASLELPMTGKERLEFYALIGSEYGILVKPNLSVQIEVAGVDAKRFGYLIGDVVSVSPYPVSQSEILTMVPNPELAQFLRSGQAAVYAVTIKLRTNPELESGFEWTTKTGPPNRITSGTLGVARIIVIEKRPIFYIIPEDIGPFVQDFIPRNTPNKPNTPKGLGG